METQPMKMLRLHDYFTWTVERLDSEYIVHICTQSFSVCIVLIYRYLAFIHLARMYTGTKLYTCTKEVVLYFVYFLL